MFNAQSTISYPASKGFTVIEIVITIVIIGILASLAAGIIVQVVKTYAIEDSRSDILYQAKLAAERMARELRTMRSATAADITTMNGTTLLYNDINGTQMGFRLNAGKVERTQDNGATWLTLATNITGGTIFTYLDNTGVVTASKTALWLVQVQVAATRGTESVTMRATVHPMNF